MYEPMELLISFKIDKYHIHTFLNKSINSSKLFIFSFIKFGFTTIAITINSINKTNSVNSLPKNSLLRFFLRSFFFFFFSFFISWSFLLNLLQGTFLQLFICSDFNKSLSQYAKICSFFCPLSTNIILELYESIVSLAPLSSSAHTT